MIGPSSLLRDRRGATGGLTGLILVCSLALAGIAGVRMVSGSASKRSDCAGEQIAAFGGPVPCNGNQPVGAGAPTPPPKAPEGQDGGEPKAEEFDPQKELVQLALDILGITDAVKCFTEGDILACVMTVVSLSPFKAIGVAIKLAKNAKKIANAVDRFLAFKKAKKAEDEAREAKEAADKVADAGKQCKGDKCTRPGECFVAGTPVHTEDGWVPIEELEAGDMVLSRDDQTGEEAYRPIEHVFITPDKPVLALTLEDSMGALETIEATLPHPFFVADRGWVAASDLRPDDQVVSSGGGRLRVAATTGVTRRTTVYNFEVEDFHTYFVGLGAAWVHNKYDSPQEELDAIQKALKEGKNSEGKKLTAKEKQDLRARKKELDEQLGKKPDRAAEEAAAVDKELGDLADVRNERAADVIRGRGGTASNVRRALGDKFKDATVEDLAKAAAAGDESAKTALKIVREANRLGQRGKRKGE